MYFCAFLFLSQTKIEVINRAIEYFLKIPANSQQIQIPYFQRLEKL